MLTESDGLLAQKTVPFRLALVSDMLEEKWYSMDLISDMLFEQISSGSAGRWSAHQVRPALKRISSATRFTANSSLAWTLDRILNRNLAYPRFLRSRIGEFDLYHIVDHSYANLVDSLPAGSSVVTCHDLDAFRCILEPPSGTRSRLLRRIMLRALKGMQTAAHTIFVSHAVRNSALELGIVGASKSSVIPMGVHPSCTACPNDIADRTAEKYLSKIGGRHPILLHVGSTVRRKRLDIVLQVLAEVSRTLPDAILVRVGGQLTEEQRRLALTIGVNHRVLELPYLERNVLAAIYRRANVVLQPSEAEGFGLPVVEAMACGCPVIASDLEVLREVGGTAAVYCPVGDVDYWTREVLRLLRSTRSHSRSSDERQRSIAEQASKFSWIETTKRVVQVYEQVIAKRGMNTL